MVKVKSNSGTHRTSLAIYIQDAQFASTFHNDPMVRHQSIRLPSAVDDKLFFASTASQWANILRSTPAVSIGLNSALHVNQVDHSYSQPLVPELACKNSRFSCYVILHGIGTAVMEQNATGQMQQPDIIKYQDALMCWYHAYEKTRPSHESDPLGLMILFHEIFMSLMVDFDQLERAIGRDGPSETTNAIEYARKWSTTTEAKRCVTHASLLYQQASGMRVDLEPAIHVPKAMFQAAIAWYCYIQFDSSDASSQSSQESVEIPEAKFWDLTPPQLQFGAGSFTGGKPKIAEASTLCGVADLLHRIGHWGLSRRFARILGFLIYGDPGADPIDTSGYEGKL